MTLFDRLKHLANKQGKSINDVENDMGYSKNTLYRLKNSNPSSEKLKEIADYFKVSTDYLLGRTDNPNVIDIEEQPSMAKQVMMRMDTNGLSEKELDEIESEMERFFAWRLEEIKRERDNEK